MPAATPAPSARQTELLERAYRYALQHGLAELSLRPLAAAIGSSPGVLLFLVGSKEGLVQSLLQRARADELAVLRRIREAGAGCGLRVAAVAVWDWLAAAEHRALLTLWLQAYSRSLTEPAGPWAGFAADTVRDWLTVLGELAPGSVESERTLVLAVLRGGVLDLLATGDVERVGAAVRGHLAALPS